MGNQQSNTYPMCSIQYDCERNKQEQKVANQSLLLRDSSNNKNMQLTDDYFGKVVVIKKRVVQSPKQQNLNGNLDIQKDQGFKEGQQQFTSSCLILEKAFQDENQLNEALKSVNMLQKIVHRNLISIQSTQTIVTTNQNKEKIFLGRVQCDFYNQNLLSVLKKRKLIMSQLNQRSSSKLNADKKSEQTTPSSTQRSSLSQKNLSKQNGKKYPSCQTTPRANQQAFVPAFTEKEIWYIIDSLANTMNLLQTKSIIHGDLRPQTVFFTEDGHLKLSIVQCFNKDFSHTNFHIAAQQILKRKSLLQKICEDNILLSVEQLNQLHRLVNTVSQNAQNKIQTREQIFKFEFNPYKSQVFSFGILLLQIIFCGSIECSSQINNSQQIQTKQNSYQTQQLMQNSKYLYTKNERTQEVIINFQLISDLLKQVKQLFSPSLYQILCSSLEAKEEKRPDCIELFNLLHNLDLQTEVSTTMDEFVTAKVPLQLDYQQNLSQKLRKPSLDLSTLERTPKHDEQSLYTSYLKTGEMKIQNNPFLKKNEFIENLIYSTTPKTNIPEINFKQNLNSTQKNQNNFINAEPLRHNETKKTFNQKNLDLSQKIFEVDTFQINKNEVLFSNSTKSSNFLNQIQNYALTSTNKQQSKQQLGETDKERIQKEIKLQLETDQKNYQNILRNKSYSMAQSYDSKTPKNTKNLTPTSQQFRSIKQQINQIQIPTFKISECNLQNEGFIKTRNISLLVDQKNYLISNCEQENIQQINQKSQDNKYSSQFCPNLSQQKQIHKLLPNNESLFENRISNISDYPTLHSTKEQSLSNNMKDNYNSHKDSSYISNWSSSKDNYNILNQNQTTLVTTARRQSESSTLNQSLSTTFQFYNPLANQAVLPNRKSELSSPLNAVHQKYNSLHLNGNNDFSSQKQMEQTNKNYYLLNTQEKNKYVEIQKEILYKSTNDQASKQNVSYLSNDLNLNQSKLQSPQLSTLSIHQNNLFNSSNQTLPFWNNSNNNTIQQRSINLNENVPLFVSGKQNISQPMIKDSQNQVKNANQYNSTTVDNSNSFLSSLNFRSENFNCIQAYQPEASLNHTILKSPQSLNILKLNEQNLQYSQIIQQSIDLNDSISKKTLGENGQNLNPNTYTFSSPQNQRLELLKNSEFLYSDEKVKNSSKEKTNQYQSSLDNPLYQTAKFINESSRHYFSTSIQERLSKYDSQKEENKNEVLNHVYGSPQRVIVSRSNIQTPLHNIKSPTSQRNKSTDLSYRVVDEKRIDIYSPNYNSRQNDLNNNNNSKTLIIYSPSKNASKNTKNQVTPSRFESEKSFLNQLIKNDEEKASSNQVFQTQQSEIYQIQNQKETLMSNDQNDLMESVNKKIEIQEWNDIESQMSENLQNSIQECIKVNNTLLNCNTRGLTSLMDYNKQFPDISNKQFPDISIQTGQQSTKFGSNQQNTGSEAQQDKKQNVLQNDNIKNIKSNSQITYQFHNLQNIQNTILQNNSQIKSQQQPNHKRYQSTNLASPSSQENWVPRTQSYSIHQLNITSPKQDAKNIQKSQIINNHTQIENKTIQNKSIYLNNSSFQNNTLLNNSNLLNIHSNTLTSDQFQSNQKQQLLDKTDKESSFQAQSHAKVLSNQVVSKNNLENPFYTPYSNQDNSKKILLLNNNSNKKILQQDNKQYNNSLQTLKLNHLLSPNNLQTQIAYKSLQSQIKNCDNKNLQGEKQNPQQSQFSFQLNFNKSQIMENTSKGKQQLNNSNFLSQQQQQQKFQFSKQQTKIISDNFTYKNQIS